MIKNYSVDDLKKITVDGEDFYLTDSEQSNDLLSGSTIDNEVCFSSQLVRSDWNSVSNYQNLELGLHRGVFSRNKWWHCVLVKINEHFHRVKLQRESCAKCTWEGRIGNPLQEEIYTGSDDKEAALKSAMELPPVCCPNCGAPFEALAIWSESAKE